MLRLCFFKGSLLLPLWLMTMTFSWVRFCYDLWLWPTRSAIFESWKLGFAFVQCLMSPLSFYTTSCRIAPRSMIMFSDGRLMETFWWWLMRWILLRVCYPLNSVSRRTRKFFMRNYWIGNSNTNLTMSTVSKGVATGYDNICANLYFILMLLFQTNFVRFYNAHRLRRFGG